MKLISDIRLFKSEIPNVDGNDFPADLNNKKLNVTVHRIVMKLRENGFSLGDFDHLYINLTTCSVSDKICASDRSIDKYFPWFRFYDAQIDCVLYENIDTDLRESEVASVIENVLYKFATPEFNTDKIHSCVEEALTQKENMLMLYKEKKAYDKTAMIFLRYMNSGVYKPLLRVINSEGKVLLEKDLPKSTELNHIGEIALGKKRVTIKPRKNAQARALKSIVFDIPQ